MAVKFNKSWACFSDCRRLQSPIRAVCCCSSIGVYLVRQLPLRKLFRTSAAGPRLRFERNDCWLRRFLKAVHCSSVTFFSPTPAEARLILFCIRILFGPSTLSLILFYKEKSFCSHPRQKFFFFLNFYSSVFVMCRRLTSWGCLCTVHTLFGPYIDTDSRLCALRLPNRLCCSHTAFRFITSTF